MQKKHNLILFALILGVLLSGTVLLFSDPLADSVMQDNRGQKQNILPMNQDERSKEQGIVEVGHEISALPDKPRARIGSPDFSRFPLLNLPIYLMAEDSNPKIFIHVNGFLQKPVKIEGKNQTNREQIPIPKRTNSPTIEERQNKKKIERNFPTPIKKRKMRVLLLLDISGSLGEKGFLKAKQIANHILSELSPMNDLNLATFGDYVYIPPVYTDNANSLNKRLEHYQLSEKKTLLYRALYQAIEHEKQADIIVMISDGIDNGSKLDLEQVVEKAQEKKIPLSLYGLGQNKPLQSLAHAVISTGGKYFPDTSTAGELSDFLQKFTTMRSDMLMSEKKDRQMEPLPQKNSLHTASSNKEGSTALPYTMQQWDILLDLGGITNLIYPTPALKVEIETDKWQWTKESELDIPLKKLIPFYITKYPLQAVLISVIFLLLLALFLTALILRKRPSYKKVSRQEMEKIKTSDILARKNFHEDNQTYSKLYQDSLRKAQMSKFLETGDTSADKRKSKSPAALLMKEKDNEIFQESRFENEKKKFSVHPSQRNPENKGESTVSRLEENEERIDEISLQPSAELVVLNGLYKDRRFPLYYRETSIGRDEEAGISINDPYVSPIHCKIKKIDDDYVLFDTLSQNGTYLNKKKLVRPKVLDKWSEIQIGKTVFQFRHH